MQLQGCDISRLRHERAQLLQTFALLQGREVKDMGEILRLASMVVVADQPFYKNVYVIVPAALVVAVIILVVALLLFRSSGKKKRASTAGSSDWQRQAQQGAPGGWNQQGMGMPAAGPWGQQGQQPNMWGAQQPSAWGAQNPAQQQAGGWGAQSPAPQQQQPNT